MQIVQQRAQDKLNKVEKGKWEEDVSSFRTKSCLFKKASEFFATGILVRFLQNWIVLECMLYFIIYRILYFQCLCMIGREYTLSFYVGQVFKTVE